MVPRTASVVAALMAALLTASCSGGSAPKAAGSAAPGSSRAGKPASGAPSNSATGTATTTVPQFDHIVVVVLENHAYSQLVGRSSAPFLNALADRGAVLTRSYAITHPSEPNYLAMFSGSTHGLSDDSCPHTYTGPNLAASLLAAGQSFTGYSEDLPAAGYTGCSAGAYARKHNPWVNFTALPASINLPLTAFPNDLSRLPTVSFVIPNLDNDMHDGTVAQGDRWLQAHLGEYADWSTSHNSLLIVTADEDDKDHDNRIATIFTGARVRPGRYTGRTDHYGLLATLLASCRLAPFEAAAQARPVTTIWTR
jgi:acid phosphatase